jgi:hypothetical protein
VAWTKYSSDASIEYWDILYHIYKDLRNIYHTSHYFHIINVITCYQYNILVILKCQTNLLEGLQMFLWSNGAPYSSPIPRSVN